MVTLVILVYSVIYACIVSIVFEQLPVIFLIALGRSEMCCTQF